MGVKYKIEYGALDKNSSLPLDANQVKEKFLEVKAELLKMDDIDQAFVNDTFEDSLSRGK